MIIFWLILLLFAILGIVFWIILLYFICFPFDKNKSFSNILANRFIIISNNINNFKELVEEIKNKQIIELNDKYKLKVLEMYEETLKYEILTDKEINGIDVIACKDNEIHLIHYTNHFKNPTRDMFISFIGNCDVYVQKNQDLLENKKVIKTFITSCDKIDYDIQKWFEENHNIINYIKI